MMAAAAIDLKSALSVDIFHQKAHGIAQEDTSSTYLSDQWLKLILDLQHHAIAKNERLYWMMAMRDCLQFRKGTISHELHQGMLALAERLCDWPMLIELLNHINEPLSASQCLQLANAHFMMGDPLQALFHVEKQLLREPLNKELDRCFYNLQRIQAESPWHSLDTTHGVLRLTPLSHYHLQDFTWQYDLRIAELCNLPEFHSDQHWFAWLNDNLTEANKWVFAVIHCEFGFIGSVSLEVHNGVGFFYYWLGDDFQGQGYGPQAVELLLSLGSRYLAMHCCYAKVYDYNQYSRKAMTSMGFKSQGFEVLPPFDNEVFYYRGVAKSQLQMFEELSNLLVDMDSELQLSGCGQIVC